MKKLLSLITVSVLLLGSAAMISCDKESACNRAESKCEECYTGNDLSNCKAIVSACKILLPGPPRDDCCDSHYESIKDCQ